MNNEAPATAPRLIDGPDVAAATVLLADLHPPTLILQGERDTFGRPEEVATYSLSPQVRLQWIPCGDHSFKPTRSSGLSEKQNLATAVACSHAFLTELLECISQATV